MTIQTFAPATTSDNPLDRHDLAAGRADAHYEHKAGPPLGILHTRLDWLLEKHANTSYVLGYAAVVAELQAAAYFDRATEIALTYLDEAAL